MADGAPHDIRPGASPERFEERLHRLEDALRSAIVELMEARRISRAGLAKKLGVSRPAITQLLNQDSNLTLRRLLIIADALGCRLDVTFHEPGKPPHDDP